MTHFKKIFKTIIPVKKKYKYSFLICQDTQPYFVVESILIFIKIGCDVLESWYVSRISIHRFKQN